MLVSEKEDDYKSDNKRE